MVNFVALIFTMNKISLLNNESGCRGALGYYLLRQMLRAAAVCKYGLRYKTTSKIIEMNSLELELELLGTSSFFSEELLAAFLKKRNSTELQKKQAQKQQQQQLLRRLYKK